MRNARRLDSSYRRAYLHSEKKQGHRCCCRNQFPPDLAQDYRVRVKRAGSREWMADGLRMLVAYHQETTKFPPTGAMRRRSWAVCAEVSQGMVPERCGKTQASSGVRRSNAHRMKTFPR